MHFTDILIFGVYVAPIVPMLVVAAILTPLLTSLTRRAGLTRHVWHPALFNVAIYIIVLFVVCVSFGAVGA